MRPFRAHLAPLFLFCCLTLLLAFPIVAGIGSAVPGWEGDNLYYVRSMWWLKHALFDLRISPFFDPTSFYPVGEHIARSEMTPANTVLGLPLTLLWTPETAYSVIVLFSFVATALGTYFWVTHLTGSRSAGIAAGTIAAFLPLRFAHLPGHLPQVTTQWLPWTLFAFERFLERRTIGRGAWLGVSAALVVLGCWYYGYALALMLPLYVVLRTWPTRAIWREGAWWRGVAVAGVIAFALVLPFLVQMLALAGAGELKRSISEMDSWSLPPYDFFLPNLLHPAWGETASRWFPRQRALWVERGVALGYVAVAAALIGLLSRRTGSGPDSNPQGSRHVRRALVGVWIASFLIALGPTLWWKGEQVRLHAPRFVVAAFVRSLALIGGDEETHALRSYYASNQLVPVPLPSFYMYYLVPVTASMRIMSRFGVWTGLMTAALAGFGLLRLTDCAARRWGPGARRAVPAMLVAAVAFESLSVIPMLNVGPREVDLWLASEPGDTLVVELPVEQAIRPFQNYWATIHQRPMVFGWNGDSFPPAELFQRMEALKGFPSPESLAFLRTTGVTYVLMTPSQIPDWPALRPRLEIPELKLERLFGEVHVYRVRRDTVSRPTLDRIE